MAEPAQTVRMTGHEDLTTGERIRVLRERRHMRRLDFAPLIGVSVRQLTRYERDEVSPPADVLRAVAVVLATTTDYLVGLKGSPTRAKLNGKPPRSAVPLRQSA